MQAASALTDTHPDLNCDRAIHSSPKYEDPVYILQTDQGSMEKVLEEELQEGRWIEESCREAFENELLRCALKVQMYNTTALDTYDKLRDAISDITGTKIDETSLVLFPFRCDIGLNIHIGKHVLVNYDCTFLDTARITIGDYTKIGPGCHLVTADHPRDHIERRSGKVRGFPITIGEDCWLGANVTVLPGVTIGDRSIIGAGSVVVRDVPANSIYAGNPARPIHTDVPYQRSYAARQRSDPRDRSPGIR